jgi:hypothetical protein
VVVSAPDTVKVVEGKHTIDDVVVVATSQATSFFGEIQQKLAQGFDVDTIVTSLVPGLHSITNSALSCMAFISFEEPTPVVEEKPLFEIAVEAIETPTAPIEETHEQPLRSPKIFVEEASLSIESTPPPQDLGLRESPRQSEPAVPALASDPAIPAQPTEQAVAVPPREQANDLPLSGAISNSTPPPTSHSLEVHISSSTTDKVAATVGPVLKTIGRLALRLGNLLVAAVKKTPALLRNLKNRAQPLYAGGQYVTSLPKQQLIKLIVPILLIAALLVGGVLAWQRWTASQVKAAAAALEPLEVRFALAQAKVETQPLEARSEIEKILDEWETTKSQFSRQPAATKFIDVRHQEVLAIYDEVSGQHSMSALPVFFDLQSVQSDLLVSRADADATRAALLDTEKKQLLLLDLAAKESQAISLESISKIVHLSLTPNEVLILGSGIRKLDVNAVSSGLLVIKEEGDSNRDGTLIGSFGAYIYIVNPVKRNIYRYAPADDGYTDPIGWLKPGQSLPYDQLTSIAIDGDVWLGTREGDLLKLTQGGEQEFEIKGLPKPFEGTIHVYTKENLNQLYILEPGLRRLVILKKNGEFVREVTSDSLASATSVFADETLKKAFAVSGSLVFEIEL